MRAALKIAQVAGIGIFVHWSFLILPAMVGISVYSAGGGIVGVVDAIIYVLAIFGCVVLHELGHALTARRFGVGTRDITLYPIGGVARLERMPRNPVHELAIALAGPAVNVVIAALLFALVYITGGMADIFSFKLFGGPLLVKLMWANVALVVFNMLPAFPMDGGRVLRALLATQLSYERATQIAAGVGQGMAVLLGVLGLFTMQPMLMLVALFVFLAARGESAAVARQAAYNAGRPVNGRHASVGDIVDRNFEVVQANGRLDDVAQLALFSQQDDFPVVHDGQLVGMLNKGELLHAMAQGHRHLRVANVMSRNVPVIEPGAALDATLDQMQTEDHSSVLVGNRGQLIGLLSLTRLRRWLDQYAQLRPAT